VGIKARPVGRRTRLQRRLRVAARRASKLAVLRPLARRIAPAGRRYGIGLPAKLLTMTAFFVMLAEVVIFVPSIANFRVTWLSERLVVARLAALATDAVPGGTVPETLRRELLDTAQVRMVSLKRKDQRRLLMVEDMEADVDATFDLRPSVRSPNPAAEFLYRLSLIRDALAVFVTGRDRMIRVIGQPSMESGVSVDIVLRQQPLYDAMVSHGINILLLSILISVFTGWLVYVAINASFIRPIMKLSANMLRYSEKPEDASRIIEPSRRNDEIGTAERQLQHMQTELNSLLAQKNRLAALGLAVSKINHDLRNLLANAQLVSDNLASLPDPRVQRFASKLIASLDRAINLCNDTLRFGKAAEQPPRRELFPLRPLVEEAAEALGLPRPGSVEFVMDLDLGLEVDADSDQLYRVFSNLLRNAAQAIEASSIPGEISVKARREPTRVVIDVSDTGPGLPPRAREHLFKPFQGSVRPGGSGLGLAIAQELIAALGGELRLLDDHRIGTHFRMEIPDRRPAA
jgi:signal transduction histidine kinase